MHDIALTPHEGYVTERAGRSLLATAPASENFGDLLQSSLERVGRAQNEADRAVEDLTLGRQTDIHSTMIAVEKAGIALELALQIRNKLLNAYETLMRQQI
jgi:flagellar hook-basal body complex protein FliE